MEEQSEYITATATATLASQLGGTVLIDPAALGDGPCEIHRLDEDYWREILRQHWYEWNDDRIICDCGGFTSSVNDVGASVDEWIDHVLHIAAITPEPYRGDSDA